jgi:uncharacterized protein YyaL (SSP411 family)
LPIALLAFVVLGGSGCQEGSWLNWTSMPGTSETASVDVIEIVEVEEISLAELRKSPWKLRTPAEVRQQGNFLKDATSHYLKQHAENPMEWYGWSPRAIERATKENKPIFLSVGYAACHWCQVMEGEVFDDDDTAAFMNEHFVNIKVDREERPDIDAIYMDAVLKMNEGKGGWPMTVVMTPSLKPFFGGTYFPKARFYALMKQTAERFVNEREVIDAQSEEVVTELNKTIQGNPTLIFNYRALRAVMRRALDAHDQVNGGLVGAMKFPTPVRWRYLLNAYRKWGNLDLRQALRLTLDKMSQGGLHDHVGGGFHRYTVDATWTIPHFEKMLYDNAQIASLFLEAGAAFDDARYREIGKSCADFLVKELLDPKGGFYASYAADSADKEGAFYLWTPEELRKIAGDRDGTALAAIMGVTADGNFEEKTSVVTRRADLEDIGRKLSRPVKELRALFDTWRPTLYQVRTKRPWPKLDPKMVTGWNGLAISAVAKAYIITREPRFLKAGMKSAERIWTLHRSADGHLARASTDGQTSEQAILDDYAFFAVGLLDLFEASGKPAYLEWAKVLVAEADARFRRQEPGWFQTPMGDKTLLYRHFEPYDSVLPSGNSQMLEAHLRLAFLTGTSLHFDTVRDTLATYTDTFTKSGLAMGGWASVALRYEGPFYEVVIAGGGEQRTALDAAWRTLKPTWAVKVDVPPGGLSERLSQALPPAQNKVAEMGKATAYVCVRGACLKPTSDPKEFIAQLRLGWEH